MKKFPKRLTCLALTLAITFSLSVPAFAAAAPSTNLQPVATVVAIESKDAASVETRSVATSAVKKAIRWALKHTDDFIKAAANLLGDDAADMIAGALAKATPVLEDLLAWDTLVWQTIQDQLTHVVGSQAAVWIRMALEFLL